VEYALIVAFDRTDGNPLRCTEGCAQRSATTARAAAG
jgi:hypothetical protein